jgi:hypothetical protein
MATEAVPGRSVLDVAHIDLRIRSRHLTLQIAVQARDKTDAVA